MTDNRVAKRLKVNGIVQGVGFRPFVFQLAEKYELKGEVANTSSGVSIHVEGLARHIACFEEDLGAKSPPLAYVVEITNQPEAVKNYAGFAIVKSKGESEISTLISPDVSVCDDCLAELLDLMTVAITILLLIAPTADRATPSSTISPTIGRKLPCGRLKCVPPVSPNTMIRTTGGFTLNRMPAQIAAPMFTFMTTAVTGCRQRTPSVKRPSC